MTVPRLIATISRMDRMTSIDADPDVAEFAVQRERGTSDCVGEMSAVRFP
jgi:hypothetical protein